MNNIAFVLGDTFLYWNAIMLTLSVAASCLLFIGFYGGKSGNLLGAAVVIPLSMACSMVLARAVHWYCRTDSYHSFFSAVTDYSSGGYALLGVFAGCFLAALLLRLLRLSRDLPEMLDGMCLAGCAGIALGRLQFFFTAADRGQILQNFTGLPWAWPVTNTVSGALEYRFATFLFQAAAAGALFVGLTLFYILRGKKTKSGDVTLLFLLIYGASQVLLDSTRYDSLFFRSNGFVSMVQVFSALGLGLAIVVFSCRMVKNRGFSWMQLLLWIPIAGFVGLAGFMEYYVQRHGDRALFAYGMMGLSLTAIVALTLVIRGCGLPQETEE